jgi:hypothetical protein
MTADLILARAERLCLLTALHRARKAHAPTATITRRLVIATARLAAMEAGNETG